LHKPAKINTQVSVDGQVNILEFEHLNSDKSYAPAASRVRVHLFRRVSVSSRMRSQPCENNGIPGSPNK